MVVKVAVVTGSNKGIGFSIVKGLCAKFEGIVYLTARDETRGKAAVERLKKLGFNPCFHQLDIGSDQSVIEFRDYIEKTHGGIDILVNNAAVLDFYNIYPTYEESKAVIDINFYGVVRMEKYIYPLLRQNARVVNVSSSCGHLSNIRNKYWIQVLSHKDLTVEQINEFIEWYLDSVKNGTFNKEDFADEGKHAEFKVSKVALAALTLIQQKKYLNKNISVNSVYPGFVKTDMSLGKGEMDQDEGASAPLYLALEASQSLKGVFMWCDRKLVDWYDSDGDYYCKNLW